MTARPRQHGFTLIETLAAAGVLVLISALVAASVSRLASAREASRAQARAWGGGDRCRPNRVESDPTDSAGDPRLG